MLIDQVQQLQKDVDQIKQFLATVPTWIPLSSAVAKERGYTVDGLRRYCEQNIHPDLFKKFGRIYHIHKSALHLIKSKSKK